MKKIFFWLLRQYSKTEIERLKVFEILHNQVGQNYREQTQFGNLYNANIEFIMSSPLINWLIETEDVKGIYMSKQGLQDSFTSAIGYLKIDSRVILSDLKTKP